jgi:hypothetical protein
VSKIASSVIRRVEFTPLRLDPVATLTVEISERDSSIVLFLDGEPLAEVGIDYNYESEGEARGARHHLRLKPYRTPHEWDEGPTVEVVEPSDPYPWVTMAPEAEV